MKKEIYLLLLLAMLSISLCGCWDYSEYEKMTQIVAIGADYNKESHETTLTVQYVPTAKSGGSMAGGSMPTLGKEGIVYSATDKTLYGALSKLQQIVTKRLFYGYLKIYVLGEDAAKYNLLDQLELLDRTPAIRNNALFVITSGKAENVISTADPSGTASSSEEIYDLIRLAENTGKAFPVTIQDFTAMIAIDGLEATAPRVISSNQSSAEAPAAGELQNDIRFDERAEGDLIISGTAVFKKDKFAGWLNDKESMGYGWITSKKMRNYMYSEVSGEEDTADILYFRINRLDSKIKVEMINNEPVVNLNIKAFADLRKFYSDKGSNFITPERIKLSEEKLTESIKSDVEAVLQKCQKEYESDIFGFGFAFFRKYPKLWHNEYEKKWDDIFPNLPVNINIDTKIINSGTNIKELEVK